MIYRPISYFQLNFQLKYVNLKLIEIELIFKVFLILFCLKAVHLELCRVSLCGHVFQKEKKLNSWLN